MTAEALAPYGWTAPARPERYGDLLDALATFQHRFAGARPDAAIVDRLERALRTWTGLLEGVAVPEDEQLWGHLVDRPDRGQLLTPPFTVTSQSEGRIRGTVTFGRWFLGNNGAVHGGVIPLLLDEFIGGLAGSGGRPVARTASLTTDFRSITPVEVPLDVEAWFESEEGRKRWLRAEIRHGDTLCVEARALFLTLLPGQP